MSVFLLDTDTLSLLQGHHAKVFHAVNWHRQSNTVGLTAITIEEQINGLYKRLRKAQTPKAIAEASMLLVNTTRYWCAFDLFTMTEPATARFESLLKLKLNVGRMDLRIAAIALEQNATVVTRNLRDFSRVPGLVVVDWSV